MNSFAKLVSVSALYLLPLSSFSFGNEDVVKLLSAGFEEDIVLNAISTANPATFDTSAAGLIKLKEAGVSTAVIQKVLTRQGANNPTNKVTAGSIGMNNAEECRAEVPNMENMITVRTEGKIIGLKPQKTGISHDVDVGSAFASIFTFGIARAKGSSSYTIPGKQAAIRMTGKTPEFVDLLIPVNLLPEDLISLVRMTVKEELRTIQIATASKNISGNQGHSTLGDSLIPVVMEKVSDFCSWRGKNFTQYRMKPIAPLANGEYGILTSGKIFDFGIE